MKDEARKIHGKGWMVRRIAPFRFQAVLKPGDGTTIFHGERATHQDALRCAISGAFAAGCLDWAKTVRWCKLMGIDVPYEYIKPKEIYAKKLSKGWYIDKHRYYVADGEERWHYGVRFGLSHKKSVYMATRSSLPAAIRYALSSCSNNKWFDKDKTHYWLLKKGHSELLPYFYKFT